MSSAASASDLPVAVATVLPLVPAWRVDRPFDYVVPVGMDATVGSLVRVAFGGRRVRAVVLSITTSIPDRPLEEILGIVFPAPVAPPPMTEVLRSVARRYVVPAGRAFSMVVPPRVRVRVEDVGSGPSGPAPDRLARYKGGTDLATSLRAGNLGTWCVRTLPGEDHGALIAEIVAAADGRALVAVPEVRYGSSVIETLTATWPDICRVDSSTPDNERSAAWARLAEGAGPGVGGRATVFAPAVDVGVVVVDEEHHPSFKEDRAPRYDARWVALERARLSGAATVLVSGTPSVETGAATESGRYFAVEPERQAERAARPVIEMVEPQEDRAISHTLHDRIRRTLRNGGRAALLVPGRGYARALWCSECRRSARCPLCEAGLFYDRGPRRVRCVRCGYYGRPPDSCAWCGADDFRFVGLGSERLEEQISSSFPRARVMRVDPDVLESGDPVPDIGGSDIYVTTWIGTKAVLRPEVSLVGVLDADWMIRRPDFRAAERGYQALAEMAEWAGPASSGGRLVLQTTEPRHHALQALARADYRFFLTRELVHRKELSYPPFSELVKVTAAGSSASADIAEVARVCRAAGATVLGPITVRGEQESLQVLIKCSDAMVIADALGELVRGQRVEGRVRIDVDPR